MSCASNLPVQHPESLIGRSEFENSVGLRAACEEKKKKNPRRNKTTKSAVRSALFTSCRLRYAAESSLPLLIRRWPIGSLYRWCHDRLIMSSPCKLKSWMACDDALTTLTSPVSAQVVMRLVRFECRITLLCSPTAWLSNVSATGSAAWKKSKGC